MNPFNPDTTLTVASRLAEDFQHAPDLPWNVDDGNLFDARWNRIAGLVRTRDGKFLAALAQSSQALSEMTLHLLWIIASANDGDDEAIEQLRVWTEQLVSLKTLGKLTPVRP